MNTDQIELFRTPNEIKISVPEHELCGDLDDVPQLKGPLMPYSATLLRPPIDLTALVAAYRAAEWNLCVRSSDQEKFWQGREKPQDAWQVWEKEFHEGMPPDQTRILEYLERDIRSVQSGCDWTLGGGLIVFRSKSGKIGVLVETVIGRHYKRIKEDSVNRPS